LRQSRKGGRDATASCVIKNGQQRVGVRRKYCAKSSKKKKRSLPFLLEAVLAERHDFRYRSIKSGDMEWVRDGKVEEGKVARRSDWGNQAQG
jgi:hypothetical protein